MARQPRQAAEADRPPVAERLHLAGAPWLDPARERLAAAREAGRLAHGILLHGLAGAGQSPLALWSAQLTLCETPLRAPCGRCGSCVLFLAGNHPDFHPLEPEEGSAVIKVDQVRELCGKLGMRSYRGGAKVALIDPADRMNPNSNNALLKTLEEPPEDTLLLLVASRPERLAATVSSRCQKIRIATPPSPVALTWLQHIEARDDWPALLALAAGAPLRAVELAGSGAGELAAEMAAALRTGGARGLDPLGLADVWSKDRPAERLAWLEYLISAWIRGGPAGDVVNNNRDNALPSPPARLNMRAAFGLLDRVREARDRQEGALNTLLLFEDLLVGFAEAFAGGTAVRPETQG